MVNMAAQRGRQIKQKPSVAALWLLVSPFWQDQHKSKRWKWPKFPKYPGKTCVCLPRKFPREPSVEIKFQEHHNGNLFSSINPRLLWGFHRRLPGCWPWVMCLSCCIFMVWDPSACGHDKMHVALTKLGTPKRSLAKAWLWIQYWSQKNWFTRS